MNKLQEEIFLLTKKLTGQINIIRIFLYTLVTSTMLVVALSIFGLLTWQIALISVGISLLYSYVRDYFITKYSNKQMYKFYDHAKAEHDDLALYVPLLEKSFQGYFLKRAALLIDKNQLYLEAFRQRKNDKQDQISIPVKYGDRFVIDHEKVDKSMKTVTMDSTFSGQYYRFSIVNHQQALSQIQKAKKGGK